MNALTVVSTDLLTPLGAYLRLRERGRASFLLESVERGRLGRHSFVGCGSRLVDFADALEGPLPERRAEAPRSRGSTRRLPSRHAYERAVVQAKEHIRAGDAFQIVLSQRAERPTAASALELYRSLRRVNPSPYLFLLELDGLALIGSSPETLVKCEGRRAGVNPIAGTTERGEGDAERLLASEKDCAEHVMLVDLGRNDLSRVCLPGSVVVERFLEPERYWHVAHLV